MLHRYQRCDAGTFIIFMDSYRDGIPEGQFYHPCRGEADSFRSLVQLLLKIEQGMDVENMPQAFQKVRTYFPSAAVWEEGNGEVLPRTGKVATFSLHIIFRRNASWQGSITWLEGGQTQSFRSALEMVALMNGAIVDRKLPDRAEREQQPMERAE